MSKHVILFDFIQLKNGSFVDGRRQFQISSFIGVGNNPGKMNYLIRDEREETIGLIRLNSFFWAKMNFNEKNDLWRLK